MIRPIPTHRDRGRNAAQVVVETCGRTDIGGRESNQDQFLIATLRPRLDIADSSVQSLCASAAGPSRHLLAVADGMGGQAGGALASQLVIETIVHELESFGLPARVDDLTERLNCVVEDCQSAIGAHVRVHPQYRGMGTTLTLACIAWPRLQIVHAGDSRAYLIRQGRARQLTTDHTLAQQLGAARGQAEATQASRWEHVLWNVIGGDGRSLHPELSSCELQAGDAVLLCTDGLMRGLSEADLTRIMHQEQTLDDAVSCLIDASRKGDGRDNITVVAARFADACPDSLHVHNRRRRHGRRTDTWPSFPRLSEDD